MKLLLMSDGEVGYAVTQWIIQNYPDDIELIATTAENEIYRTGKAAGIPVVVYESEASLIRACHERSIEIDIGLLAWWPHVLRSALLRFPKVGFVNTHPSLLPYGRGKHYNFWALVDQTPFGVTLHMVDEGVDSGDIIAQERIPYGWEDTGGTLYRKAVESMIQLVIEAYPGIRALAFSRRPQSNGLATYHHSSEMFLKSEIDLERCYSARHLINLLRARTFEGYPAAWFNDGDATFEVRINIRRLSNGSS